ncbi:MAG: ATP-dependent DNA helicase RecG [Candidatus Moraniibacteriota bacterium]
MNTKLSELSRITDKHAKKLQKLNLYTTKDLLYHFPKRYDDFSHIYDISELYEEMNATVTGFANNIKTTRLPTRRLTITSATISDDTGSIEMIWFNQAFVENTLKTDKKIRVSGKVALSKKGIIQFNAPNIERLERTPTSTGRLVPIYPETAGITSKWLRWQIQMILSKDIDFEDMIPQNILDELKLQSLGDALKTIHFPKKEIEVEYAAKRFMFEEMFILQLITLRTKASLNKEKSIKIPFDKKLTQDFIDTLPFTPTDAQKKSSFQILTDMQKTTPMNRLLNGDVGAGKTLVAAIAALDCIKAGHQVAILAPTEVLARQHFNTFINFFEKYEYNIGLLTGAHKIIGSHPALTKEVTRPNMLKAIANKELQLVIGTHAIIQDDVAFDDLALIVVDEQHRFGVAQRATLTKKTSESNDGNPNTVPHFLTMTATPIPRTFALALFGDLDVSLLDEKPGNRKEIKTQIVEPKNQNEIYAFIKNEIDSGRQAYIILPLVEESEALKNVKAAKEECERLDNDVFQKETLGLMHGRLKSKEKELLMKDFESGKIDILVSTSVVEVGVDVPNATVMIIENAERFGLSQLHQFRGRIGREKHQSHCYLFSENTKSPRLKSMEKYSDGFKLAEIDLKLRGPGQFLGSAQSGLPDGAMKNISNIKLVTISREYAIQILKKDPNLIKYPKLQQKLSEFYENVHLE